jgi:hypothetical protein
LSSSEAKYSEFANLAYEMQCDSSNNTMGLTHINHSNFFMPHVLPYQDHFGTMMQALVVAFFDPMASHGLNDKLKVKVIRSHCTAILATQSGKDYMGAWLKACKDRIGE